MAGRATLILLCLMLWGCRDPKPQFRDQDPFDGWKTPTNRPHFVLQDGITIIGRDLYWNGVAITERVLTRFLVQLRTTDPLPFIIVDGRRAQRDYARHIRTLIERDYPACAQGACGKGTAADYR